MTADLVKEIFHHKKSTLLLRTYTIYFDLSQTRPSTPTHVLLHMLRYNQKPT